MSRHCCKFLILASMKSYKLLIIAVGLIWNQGMYLPSTYLLVFELNSLKCILFHHTYKSSIWKLENLENVHRFIIYNINWVLNLKKCEVVSLTLPLILHEYSGVTAILRLSRADRRHKKNRQKMTFSSKNPFFPTFWVDSPKFSVIRSIYSFRQTIWRKMFFCC